MNTARVRLIDGTTIDVPEPAWCTGQHEHGLDLVDLVHEGPEIALTVHAALGDVEVLDAGLLQNPFSTRPEDRAIQVAVLLDHGWHRFDPDGLHQLADGLVAHAAVLRTLARQLAELQHAEQ